MTAKKKITPKKVVPEKKPDEKETEYKPIFPTFSEEVTVSYEANYYGIKQILKSFGMDLFRKLKEPEKEVIKEKEGISFNEYLNLSWEQYCKFWDKTFNKSDITKMAKEELGEDENEEK